MLTRRHIRVKVMQSIYAFTQAEENDLKKESKFLAASMENMYGLYLYLVQLLVEIHKAAEEQLEASRKKYLATSEDKNPNRKFVENQLLKQLSEDTRLSEMLEKRKLSWYLSEEYVQILWQAVQQSDVYATYMTEAESTFEKDRESIVKLYEEVIAPNEKLYEHLEDTQLTWADDLPLVNTLLLKKLKKAGKNSKEDHFYPGLFKDEEDRLFAEELFTKTILNDEKLEREMEGKTPNWDKERIAEIDGILIKMAICEFLRFPSIPVKVTINEYLEIAKEYSTPKSSIFINGILDKLVKDYQERNTLNKSGRGLQ